MKIRNGFVSNSSSSSFVMIVKKEHYEEAIKKLKDIQIKFLEYVKEEKKFAETDVLVFSIVDIMGYGTIDEFINNFNFGYDTTSDEKRYDQDEEYIFEATGRLETEILNKFGDQNIITLSEDF